MTEHDRNCGWHTDQYPWECDCGLLRPRALYMPPVRSESNEPSCEGTLAPLPNERDISRDTASLPNPTPHSEEEDNAAQSFSGSDAQERCHEAPSSGGLVERVARAMCAELGLHADDWSEDEAGRTYAWQREAETARAALGALPLPSAALVARLCDHAGYGYMPARLRDDLYETISVLRALCGAAAPPATPDAGSSDRRSEGKEARDEQSKATGGAA